MPQCFWCDRNFKKLTRDHFIPQAVRQVYGDEIVHNIVMACEICNGERGSLVCYVMEIKKYKEGFEKVKSSLCYRQEQMLKLKNKWIQIEIERKGFSPTAELNFDIPDRPSLRVVSKNNKKHTCAIYQKTLDEARLLAEKRFSKNDRS